MSRGPQSLSARRFRAALLPLIREHGIEDVAAAAGVTVPAVRHWRRTGRAPHIEAIRGIADRYRLSMDDIT